MKRLLVSVFFFFLFVIFVNAQGRLIDAVDKSPVSIASILDAAGNMVGFTWKDGTFSEIPPSSYPVTIRCVGYEQLTIEYLQDKTYEIIPVVYELDELVVVPTERNILKQIFYVREYFSLNTETDTITYFLEHMARRLIPVTNDVKFSGSSSLRILVSRAYSRYKMFDKDSVVAEQEPKFPSMLSLVNLYDEQIAAPESFRELNGEAKFYEEKGKTGVSLIKKQNNQTFTVIEDILADKEGHSISPWPLKLLGFTIDIGQLFTTHVYRVNDYGRYLPTDFIEGSAVMEANGRGKFIRKSLKSDKPVEIRSLIEVYLVDNDYLTKEEAKAETKKKGAGVEFVIPSTIPPLNNATLQLVECAEAEKAGME